MIMPRNRITRRDLLTSVAAGAALRLLDFPGVAARPCYVASAKPSPALKIEEPSRGPILDHSHPRKRSIPYSPSGQQVRG
jgi:hypothetical protein